MQLQSYLSGPLQCESPHACHTSYSIHGELNNEVEEKDNIENLFVTHAITRRKKLTFNHQPSNSL